MTLPWKQLAQRLRVDLFEARTCEGIARGGLEDALARLEEVQHCCDKAVANRAELERLEIESERRAAQSPVPARELLERISQVCPFDLDWPFQTLLEALYGQRGSYRAYHNLRHLDEMAMAYAEVRDQVGWQHPANVFAALLMHDAILIGGQADNEERSADLAGHLLPRLVPLQTRKQLSVVVVADYIHLTAHHGRHERSHAELQDRDALHFLDCDMAILGAPRERFLEYDADIAREYEGVITAEAYRAGRRAFLERLVHPEHRIFLSDFFHDRLEQRAKENLSVALET